jgi:two-component system, response regulator PdtaR
MDLRHAEPWSGFPRCVLPLAPSSTPEPVSILIVEDEVLVRAFAAGFFADAGFRTIEAANSDEALHLLGADSKVNLLFTDVNLPGAIDGLALARQASRRWPHIGIIVVSGQSMPQPHELPAGSRFHRKPYDPDIVVRHARELMAA